jgi:hypothetical protein
MDWLTRVQQQAQQAAQSLISSEAAERARKLAQECTAQATVLAQQATIKAQEVAKEALGEAEKGLQTALRHKVCVWHSKEEYCSCRRIMHHRLPHPHSCTLPLLLHRPLQASSPAPPEPAQYGITPELERFVASLTYSTFSDYPLDSLDAPSATAQQRLSAWQETHARLVLLRVPQLQDLRFVLCPRYVLGVGVPVHGCSETRCLVAGLQAHDAAPLPLRGRCRRMHEHTFWLVYFALCKRYLPQQQEQQEQERQSAADAEQHPAAAGAGAAAAAAVGASSRAESSADAGASGGGAAAGDGRAAADGRGGQAAAVSSAAPVALSASAAAVASAAAASGGGGGEGGGTDDELDQLADDPELEAYLEVRGSARVGGTQRLAAWCRSRRASRRKLCACHARCRAPPAHAPAGCAGAGPGGGWGERRGGPR